MLKSPASWWRALQPSAAFCILDMAKLVNKHRGKLWHIHLQICCYQQKARFTGGRSPGKEEMSILSPYGYQYCMQGMMEVWHL